MIEWKRYNGALVPKAPPHIEPTAEDVKAAKKQGGYRFITYATDFDCKEETPWWYVIKDTPIVLEEVKSTFRYKINKGLRYVNIRKIDCREYGQALYHCYTKAQERYTAHEGYVSEEDYLRALENDPSEYYAAFFIETDELVAYMKNEVNGECVNMSVIKYDPEYLKYQISAALTYRVLYDYLNEGRCRYALDGQRAIRHKTNIQEYLEHYFGFRKAYCRLQIHYSLVMKVAVTLLYPFRNGIERRAGDNVLLNNVASVLKMEEIRRQCRKK
ncbi:MAG: hypothetical protein IKM59_04805 [Oscillospiraceae bacterium]|nr:hypothetical protein [Oscillospiraceae bacterium]